MPLNEQYEYDCEVRGPYKAVQVRKARVIMDGDDEVVRTYHRHVLHPAPRQMESGATQTSLKSRRKSRTSVTLSGPLR